MGFLHFRFAAVYLVLLNVGITLYFQRANRRRNTDVSAHGSSARLAVIGVWVALTALFAVIPDQLLTWDFEPWPALRWMATIPAVCAILLTTWALRSRLGLDEAGRFVAEGPYRWCSYPRDAAWVVMFLSAAALGSNWVIIAVALVALLALRTLVPREQEPVRLELLGESYRDYTRRAGCFLPATAQVDQPQYTVPNRFGLTAILGLLTALAILFGILRYWESPPVVYLFVGSEIVAICLVQIIFGKAPRGGSALTGGVLLPFWVLLTADLSFLHAGWLAFAIAALGAFGALLGYCIGTLAASFFLLMAMFEPWLTGEAKPYQ